MRVETAIALINDVIYRPGWQITATDARHRFEDAVRVEIHYPAQETSREEALAPEGPYRNGNRPYAAFYIQVDGCDDIALYRRLLDRILEIEQHEAREYLRVRPTGWAPFHPHQADGMRRWGDPERDLMFGAA